MDVFTHTAGLAEVGCSVFKSEKHPKDRALELSSFEAPRVHIIEKNVRLWGHMATKGAYEHNFKINIQWPTHDAIQQDCIGKLAWNIEFDMNYGRLALGQPAPLERLINMQLFTRFTRCFDNRLQWSERYMQ